MELISVIVPVYQAEVYLEACLSSLASQSYANAEFLLVDDGSLDASAEICMRYAAADSRFQLIRLPENRGLPAARNAGLDHASGSYICFVDADDVVEPDYLQTLLSNLQLEHGDISMCSFDFFTDGEPFLQQLQENAPELLCREEILDPSSRRGIANWVHICVVTWNKLFRAEIFQDLRFPDKLHEDEFMLHHYYLRSTRIVWTPRELYHYRQRPDSITGRNHAEDLRHLDTVDAQYQRIQVLAALKNRALMRAVVPAFFETCAQWYTRLLQAHGGRLLRRRILVPYSRVLIRCAGYLKPGSTYQYARLLVSLYLHGKEG